MDQQTIGVQPGLATHCIQLMIRGGATGGTAGATTGATTTATTTGTTTTGTTIAGAPAQAIFGRNFIVTNSRMPTIQML